MIVENIGLGHLSHPKAKTTHVDTKSFTVKDSEILETAEPHGNNTASNQLTGDSTSIFNCLYKDTAFLSFTQHLWHCEGEAAG